MSSESSIADADKSESTLENETNISSGGNSSTSAEVATITVKGKIFYYSFSKNTFF